MTTSTLALPDGSTLTGTHDRGGWVYGVDPATGRTCTFKGDATGGCLVDSAGELVREVAAGAADATSKTLTKATKRARAATVHRGDRGRWVTLNTFVDRVARHLDDAEQGAWYVLFRWTLADTAEIRLKDIAARIGKSTRTVSRAVDRLIEVGLLERLKRGTRQGGPSRYRLEPDPSVALARLQADAQPQHDTDDRLKNQPKHQKRDRRGSFTT
jgi:hypothetical protein